jgi:uncharacterized protein (DUF736 family)
VRKRLISPVQDKQAPAEPQVWLDLEALAQVEFSSEDEAFPIEAALTDSVGSGWRAESAGEQIIRLIFDNPQLIRRIELTFEEQERQRTQEFVLRWAASPQGPWREIVRQQYNFSPPAGIRQHESYAVHLDNVRLIELQIVPDISGGDSRASLVSLRLA